jgi:hypothetical protein
MDIQNDDKYQAVEEPVLHILLFCTDAEQIRTGMIIIVLLISFNDVR